MHEFILPNGSGSLSVKPGLIQIPTSSIWPPGVVTTIYDPIDITFQIFVYFLLSDTKNESCVFLRKLEESRNISDIIVLYPSMTKPTKPIRAWKTAVR